MRYTAQILLFSLLCFNAAYCQEPQALTEVTSFGANPGDLKMFVHAPAAKDSSNLPLVLVLHGCGETAKSISELTGWNKLADINGFVVVYPQQKFFNNPNLCFNWFHEQDVEKNHGECASIFQMISFARQHYSIDSNRIYITGLSAGAAMSVVMTSTHPELFKGGAIFAGEAYKLARHGVSGMLGNKYIPKEKLVSYVREENPDYKGQYPPLIIYQGLNDPVVHKNNANILVNQWTGINNADTIPDKTDCAFMGIKDISRTEYTGASGRTIVTLYEINNLGHRLLIKPGDKEDEGGQTGMFGVDRGFHSTYQTAKEFGILKKN